MPRRARRGICTGIALVAGIAGAWLAAPAALAQAQQDPPPPAWSGSALDAPTDPVTEVQDPSIDVAGHFRFQKPTATSEILRVVIDVVDDPSDDFEPVDACRTEPVEVPSDGTAAADPADQLSFRVDALPVPCNGRFLLQATAETNADSSYTLQAVLRVEIVPPSVKTLSVQGDDAHQQVTVDWEPVPAEQLPPDAFGYLVERAGPKQPDGSFGTFEDRRVIEIGKDTATVDDLPEPGAYRYRVRTMAHGPDGPVLSSILGTSTKTLTVDEPPPTTTAPPTSAAPQVGIVVPRTRSTRPPSPPTTADTGYEEELDYGDVPPRTTTVTRALPEQAVQLPDGGQSIVRDEGGDGVNILVPAAGALVLLGWAGHFVYLNRLARRL